MFRKTKPKERSKWKRLIELRILTEIVQMVNIITSKKSFGVWVGVENER